MNFLAHFHVSPPTTDAVVGAFLGDFVRGRLEEKEDFPREMLLGIALHRHVDAFTDSHPLWQHSAGLLAKERRRLAGIVIDVIYDHFLCLHWETFSKRPLGEFADFCYTSLLSRTQFMDAETRAVVRRMKSHDWLNSYHKRDGIALAFRRLSYRSKALVGIQDAMEDFDAHFDEMEADFLKYYPQLVEFSESKWKELQES